MTIKKYLETVEYIDLELMGELDFADPSNGKEALENIKWALDNEPSLEALSVIIRSYYGDTIRW